MDILGDFSLEVTRWLQDNYPQLETFFLYITQGGRFEFYLVVITLSYWCIHKPLGRALGYVLTLSYVFNTMLKHLIRNPRPFWYDPSLALVTENGYGVPSGHAQSTTVFLGLLAIFIRRTWAWILATILIVLMAISRIYLGVHDLEDVVAGILLGILILLGYALWNRYLADRFNNRILGQRLLIAVSVPIILIVIYAAGLLLLGQPDRPPEFDAFMEIAERQTWQDSATIFGVFVGLSVGFVMESSRVRFQVDGSFSRRALRYMLGIGVTLALWQGLGLVFPEEPLALDVVLLFLRYMIVAVWISYYAPWVFVRLKLADARPEPEVTLTP